MSEGNHSETLLSRITPEKRTRKFDRITIVPFVRREKSCKLHLSLNVESLRMRNHSEKPQKTKCKFDQNL